MTVLQRPLTCICHDPKISFQNNKSISVRDRLSCLTACVCVCMYVHIYAIYICVLGCLYINKKF